MRERLRRLLMKNSIRRGRFTLRSGRVSDFYCDTKHTTLHPEGAYLTGHLLHSLILREGWYPEGFGGMTLGADPIVAAVASASFGTPLPLWGFIVRKAAKGHGTKAWIEGPAQRGARVVLVDDVVTTGGSTLQAIRRAEDFGMRVVGVTALLDRQEGGAEALEKYPFSPLFLREEMVD